jgi:pyruvate kinase
MNTAKTKIVCTIGPASSDKDTLKAFAKRGMDVARLNFSHGEKSVHKQVIDTIKEIEKEEGIEIAIMQDLQGPKIRTAKVENGGVELIENTEFIITTDEIEFGNSKIVSTHYKNLPAEVKKGNTILLDDGYIILKCTGVQESKVITQVVKGGLLKDNKGIIVPGSKSYAPSMSEKDLQDLKFGLENGVDLVALSFVKKAEDIFELKTAMKIFGRQVPIIAKIERAESFEHIDQIIKESDGIMVARGDLGLEMPLEELPLLQKELIKKANLAGKPVITATQMLESMINNPIPTRAETSDVANAVLDGTDAVMLSGETSIGKYPIESVEFMHKIIFSTEINALKKLNYLNLRHNFQSHTNNISDSIAVSTVLLASNINAKAIITATKWDFTARKIAKNRPNIPIIALTTDETNLAYLNLIWGVIPVKLNDELEYIRDKFDVDAHNFLLKLLKRKDIAKEGDLIVFVTGLSDENVNESNYIKVIEL